jgi:hypothetical protein
VRRVQASIATHHVYEHSADLCRRDRQYSEFTVRLPRSS